MQNNTRRGWAAAAALLVGGCTSSGPMFKPVDESPPTPAPAAPQAPSEPVSVPKVVREPAPPPKPPAAPPEARRQTSLQAAIEAYDNGRHREAQKLLRALVAAKPVRQEEVEARKYLAFIECSQNRRTQCREEFRKALAIDPSLELTPAEAGHPVWGPIFQALKKQKPRR